MEKKRKNSLLFDEFMEYMKKRKIEELEEASSDSESQWPTEYLDLDDALDISDEETETKKEEGPIDEVVKIEDELDEELLNLLGKEKEVNKEKSPSIHEELAKRWNNVIEKGLDKEEKHIILNKYPPIENMPRLLTPKLNPEAEAAMSDQAKKRDHSISIKQKQIAVAISSLGGLLSKIISNKNEVDKKEIVTRVCDAGRILCDLFYEDNKSRRFFALESLNKEMRHSLRQREPEEFLFGKNLCEGIRTAKAVAKAAQDLKIKYKDRHLNLPGPSRNNNPYQGKNSLSRGRGQIQKTQTPKPTHSRTQRKEPQKPTSQIRQRTRPHH
ncbi:hypothetical protein NE865_14076 [Phthorimaea operculella]|nr:hypothetical protein NE865_14076 [Phthorimaea operculella]